MDRMSQLIVKLALAGFEIAFESHKGIDGAVYIFLKKDDCTVGRLVNRERWRSFQDDMMLVTLLEMEQELRGYRV